MGNKIVKLSFTSEDLYNKQFKGALRGYDAFEVDLYLDKILKDYKVVESNYLMKKKDIDDLYEKIKEQEEIIQQLEVSNSSMKTKLGNIGDNKNANVSNIDLLKKIDKLERALYKLGVNPNNIK